jgi:DNA modification methylase
MDKHFQDNHISLYNADFLQNDLSAESVQCCVTSPPYWGLRRYDSPDSVWGGLKDCEHEWQGFIVKHHTGTNAGKVQNTNRAGDDNNNLVSQQNTCSLCGAWRGQFGAEPTPEMYIEHSLVFLREIKRVLRKDGICFWNLDDSRSGGNRKTNKKNTITDTDQDLPLDYSPCRDLGDHETIKPKDLCLIPQRLAIAAQMDGWYVRSQIIWAKPNGMPESCKDRPTDNYEVILMLTKSARYYYDAEAVKQPNLPASITRANYGFNDTTRHVELREQGSNNDTLLTMNITGANLRSVWTFPTASSKYNHYAAFPEELPERCIKAGSKEGDTILDPFAGTGTTLWVAKKLNRKAVGFEISSKYVEYALDRNRQGVIL